MTPSPPVIAMHMRNLAYALRTGAILPQSAADAFNELAAEVERLADSIDDASSVAETPRKERTP